VDLSFEAIFLFWFLAAVDVGSFGSAYCLSLGLDVTDLVYYTDAAKLKFDKENWLFLVLHLLDFGA